jgi:hypothetical protein
MKLKAGSSGVVSSEREGNAIVQAAVDIKYVRQKV